MAKSKNSSQRPPRPGSSEELARYCAGAALHKHAQDLVLLDVAELSGYADYFLLASARSTRQAAAIADYVLRFLKKSGVKPMGQDGLKEGRWALLDYGDVVVHVFHQPVRELYDLDSLWADAPRLEYEPDELAGLIPAGE